MGTCISKCKPKKAHKKIHKNVPPSQEACKCKCVDQNDTTLVKDKLVITKSQVSSPQPTIIPINSPSSHTTTASSCNNTNYPATSSSSSSCSLVSASSFAPSESSVSTVSSKLDRSFSNDFLWTCVKENPQVIRPDYVPISKVVYPKPRTKCHGPGRRPNEPNKQMLPPSQQTVAQKRPRCSSPSNLTRQKSFRMEIEPECERIRPVSRSGRAVRPVSPSQSRRFSREPISQSRNFTASVRRDNSYYVRPSSPTSKNCGGSRRYGRPNNLVMKRNEDGIKGVSSKIEELALGDLMSAQDMDLMPTEDPNNPHITLDCFIFL